MNDYLYVVMTYGDKYKGTEPAAIYEDEEDAKKEIERIYKHGCWFATILKVSFFRKNNKI